MKKITKKIMTLMLSLVMIFGCIPCFTNEVKADEYDYHSEIIDSVGTFQVTIPSNAPDNYCLIFTPTLDFDESGYTYLNNNLQYQMFTSSYDDAPWQFIMIGNYQEFTSETPFYAPKGTVIEYTVSQRIADDISYSLTLNFIMPKTSSPKKYSMKANEAVNGTVKLSKSRATKGSTVTINVKPDKGFTLETLTVNDAKGNELEITKEDKNEYSFKAPKGNVTVDATFMEDNSMLNFCTDVTAKDECYDAVKWAYENNITTGVNSVTFGKEITVTRAEVATLLYRAAGAPEVTNDNSKQEFNDVKEGDYFEDAVKWAANNNITQGTGDNNFEPNKACTNGEIVVMLSRADNIFNNANSELLDPTFNQVANTILEEYNNQMKQYFDDYANQMALYEKLMNEASNVENECTRETAIGLLYIQCGSEK